MKGVQNLRIWNLLYWSRILLTLLGGRDFKPSGENLRLPCLVLGSGWGVGCFADGPPNPQSVICFHSHNLTVDRYGPNKLAKLGDAIAISNLKLSMTYWLTHPLTGVGARRCYCIWKTDPSCFWQNLVKDKSHWGEGRCKVDDYAEEGGRVDCQGVRGCNLVHIDPSGVFCHAAGLHSVPPLQNCTILQWETVEPARCHDSGAFSGLEPIWPRWSRGPAIKSTKYNTTLRGSSTQCNELKCHAIANNKMPSNS